MHAQIRFVCFVNTTHVFLKMWQLRKENILTQETLKWFFTSVLSNVKFQRGGMRECFPAYFTPVRFLTAVNSLMNSEL